VFIGVHWCPFVVQNLPGIPLRPAVLCVSAVVYCGNGILVNSSPLPIDFDSTQSSRYQFLKSRITNYLLHIFPEKKRSKTAMKRSKTATEAAKNG
jgi:hypothetical protein